jgi:hypothetical protein
LENGNFTDGIDKAQSSILHKYPYQTSQVSTPPTRNSLRAAFGTFASPFGFLCLYALALLLKLLFLPHEGQRHFLDPRFGICIHRKETIAREQIKINHGGGTGKKQKEIRIQERRLLLFCFGVKVSPQKRSKKPLRTA